MSRLIHGDQVGAGDVYVSLPILSLSSTHRRTTTRSAVFGV